MFAHEDMLRIGEREPNRVALEFEGKSVTYGELSSQVLALAGGLRAIGLGPGDAVGVMLPNLPEFVAVVYGIYAGGGVIVPLNVMLTPPELRHAIVDSRIRLLVTTAEAAPRARAAIGGIDDPPRLAVVGPAGPGEFCYEDLAGGDPVAGPLPLDPDAHLLTIYTSGTSGKPKGAMLSARNIERQTGMIAECFEMLDGDRVLCVLPLFHAFALNSLLGTALRYGATVVLHPRFDLEACARSLRDDRISWFAAVPTIYAYLLEFGRSMPGSFPHLRHCLTGGAAMPAELARRFEGRFGIPLLDSYGLSETSACVCCCRPGVGGSKPGSVGPALPGAEVRAVDESGEALPPGRRGELVIRGPNVMLGYLNQPDATREAIRDGWFHSGDVGFVDEDGFVFLVDRMKDVIIKGGLNIYPREIEEVLHEHPAVSEAAVIGVPDPEKGERVLAVVATRTGRPLSGSDLHDHVRDRLARYKQPHDYVIVPELPKGPTGKILKAAVRDRWSPRPAGPAPLAAAAMARSA